MGVLETQLACSLTSATISSGAMKNKAFLSKNFTVDVLTHKSD